MADAILPRLIWSKMPDDRAGLETRVLDELRSDRNLDLFLSGEKDWSELMFHHIPLSDGNYDGPSVICTGDDETRGALFVTYEEVVESTVLDITGSPTHKVTGMSTVHVPNFDKYRR